MTSLSPEPIGGNFVEEEDTAEKPQQDMNNRSQPPPRRSSAYIEPILPNLENEDYEKYFKANGFENVEVEIKGKYAFARFPTQAEVDQFIRQFNGVVFNDTKLNVSVPISRNRSIRVKTLHVSGLQESSLTERDLYELVSPIGFLRRISWKTGFAFIEFDTIEDAQNVLDFLKSPECKYSKIKVEYARAEHRVGDIKLSIPLSDLIPENHRFWYKLQDMLYDR